MLQKLGWSEGQGLGSEGSGRIEPVNKYVCTCIMVLKLFLNNSLINEYNFRAINRLDSAGLGSERPDGVSRDDDEFDAYRKRMMLAYRFRPNPLVSMIAEEIINNSAQGCLIIHLNDRFFFSE